MVTDAEIRGLTVAQKLFMYAQAYLVAARASCEKLAADPASSTWAGGSVVLMLSAHATELFLKGALLNRALPEEVWAHGHDITALTEHYRKAFREVEFNWEVPFQVVIPNGFSAEELAVLEKLRDAAPSILYRYPVQRNGEDWGGLYSFEPNSFLRVIEQLQSDFIRVQALLV